MSAPGKSIVVGVDETLGSDAAVRWAVDEARERKLPLHLVHAQSTVWSSVPWAATGEIPPEFWTANDDVAQRVLAEALEIAHAIGEDLQISGEVIKEHPVVALPDVAQNATMLVVGSRQLGTAGSFFLGSVSGSVAAHAKCPVVVTRGVDVRQREHKPILVGVAPTELDDSVIRFAFEEASVRRAPLIAALMWHERLGSAEWLLEGQLHQGQATAQAWLSEAMAGWRDKYPDVATTPLTVEAHAASGLVHQAADAQLIVVGRHGEGAVKAALLGSVSQAVLHHATCPVAVVPASA